MTAKALEACDGWITGPIGHAAYPRNDPTWVMPPLRKRFQLFASIKPVKSYPNIKSIHKDVDIVFLREVNEGLMSSSVVIAGSGEFRPNDDISIGMRVITRKGANRVAREAFEIARTRPRRAFFEQVGHVVGRGHAREATRRGQRGIAVAGGDVEYALAGAHIGRFGELLADDLQGGADDGEIAARPGGLLTALDGAQVGLGLDGGAAGGGYGIGICTHGVLL